MLSADNKQPNKRARATEVSPNWSRAAFSPSICFKDWVKPLLGALCRRLQKTPLLVRCSIRMLLSLQETGVREEGPGLGASEGLNSKRRLLNAASFFGLLSNLSQSNWGGTSFNLLSLIAGPHPAHVRRSPLSLLSLLHIQASSRPSSLSAGAGRPQKRWLDSREAPILQPRQSRLHRWVTIAKARASLSPLSCSMRSGRRGLFEIMWSCV